MKKITIEVQGMMCGMCETHVNDAVRKNFNVKKVTSSHAKNKTEIISENSIDDEKLAEAIKATGYTVGKITTEDYEKKGFFSFLKK